MSSPREANGAVQGARVLLSVALTAALLAGSTAAGESAAPADNSARNQRDAGGETLTPMDQSNREADVELTRSIRGDVIADESLSVKARNVKIISIDGVVTLRGPVESEAEKERVAALASKRAGPSKVQNQLEVVR